MNAKKRMVGVATNVWTLKEVMNVRAQRGIKHRLTRKHVKISMNANCPLPVTISVSTPPEVTSAHADLVMTVMVSHTVQTGTNVRTIMEDANKVVKIVMAVLHAYVTLGNFTQTRKTVYLNPSVMNFTHFLARNRRVKFRAWIPCVSSSVRVKVVSQQKLTSRWWRHIVVTALSTSGTMK